MQRELAGRELGYYSLILSVLKNCSPEDAFEIIAPDPDVSIIEIRQRQQEEAYQLKRCGLSNQEIGKALGLKTREVYRRIEQYKRRANHAETSVHAGISTR